MRERETRRCIISVVVPCFNSSQTIAEVTERCIKTIRGMECEPQIILVDDSSSDQTAETIIALAKQYPCVTSILLSRNFGQHNALLAGMQEASGEYIVGLDDDLQTPPEEMGILKHEIDGGLDVVFGLPEERRDEAYRRLGSRFNAWSACLLTNRPPHARTSSYWMARRYVVKEVICRKVTHPQIQCSFYEVTSRIDVCGVKHNERMHGCSGYTMTKLMKQWGRLALYSTKPLDVILPTTPIVLVILLISNLFYAKESMVLQRLICLELLIVIFAFGILARYVAEIYQIERGVPPFVIKEKYTGGKKVEEVQ